MNALWEGVLDFESGKMTQGQVVEWFTEIVTTGYIWNLPTYYLDNAAKLLYAQHIEARNRYYDS